MTHDQGLELIPPTECLTEPLRSASPFIDVVAGSVGGIAGTVVGQPFDVMKVRLQSEYAHNLMTTMRHTWNLEGVCGRRLLAWSFTSSYG
jgi:hypothetical protein